MSYLFSQRHIGPDKEQTKIMLTKLGFSSLEDFITKIVPKDIIERKKMGFPVPISYDNWIKKNLEVFN